MTLVEILVGVMFLSLLIFVFGDALVTGKKTTRSYNTMEDELETIIPPLQAIKNDFKYAEAVRKDINGEYTIAFKQYDVIDKGYANKTISFKIQPDGLAPDATPNFKILRTLTNLDTPSTSTLEFKNIAGVKWCVDGIDAAVDCPSLGSLPSSGKIATSSRRFIVEFQYRAGLKQQGLRKRYLVASSENMPADGGFVNPVLIKP